MNLHGIVSGAINSINPFVSVTIRPSTGYTTGAGQKQVPTYGTDYTLSAQVQPITWQDLQKLDSLNIQGIRKGVYLTGNTQSIVRNIRRGGDLMIFPDGTFVEGNIWLVAHVLEEWSQSGWIKVAITAQVGTP